MKFEIRFFLLVLLLLPMSYSAASVIAARPEAATAHWSGLPFKTKKPGLFRQIRAVKAVKKVLRKTDHPSEKASKMARTAMILFCCSYAIGSLGLLSTVFTILFLAGFLTSLVLATIILFKEDNPKSRRLARLILIISAVLVVGAAIMIGLLFYFFPSVH